MMKKSTLVIFMTMAMGMLLAQEKKVTHAIRISQPPKIDGVFKANQTNSFSVRVLYYLDYMYLKRKK